MSELPQNPDDIISRIAGHYREIIRLIGEDPSREGLVDTPERAAKALYYLTRGYRQNISDVIHGALFEAPSSDMVVVRDIEFYSLCGHHIFPRHLCMQMRGVQKQNSMTVTTSSCGVFTDDCSLREQFFASIQAPADL